MDTHIAGLETVLMSQHGLVTLDQLRASGITVGQQRGLVRRKLLRPVRPRVFALVGSPDSWERGLLAAVLAVASSVASHAAAARMWNFDPRPEDRYEVTVGREFGGTAPGVTIHRSSTLAAEDVVRRNGIPCTSFERTLCDCTTRLSEYQLGRAFDEGLRRSVASAARLGACAERLESGPGRRMSAIRALLAERGIGFDPGGSRSELQVLDVFRRAGLPMPVQQHRVIVGPKTYRPDFAWPDGLVFAEYYGLPFHIGASAVVSDSERLTAMVAAGWLPLVFTRRSTDREIVESTAAALRQRGVRWEKVAS